MVSLFTLQSDLAQGFLFLPRGGARGEVLDQGYETRDEVLDQGYETRDEVLNQGCETRDEVLAQGRETRDEFVGQGIETRDEVLSQGCEIRDEVTLLPFLAQCEQWVTELSTKISPQPWGLSCLDMVKSSVRVSAVNKGNNIGFGNIA